MGRVVEMVYVQVDIYFERLTDLLEDCLIDMLLLINPSYKVDRMKVRHSSI